MTFLMPANAPPAAAAAARKACFAGGYDQTPSPTRVTLDGNKLVVAREVNESGYLLVPWPVEPFGGLVTTTSTLREQAAPYQLMVELARGKINQVRGQTAEWVGLGLRVPPEFERDLSDTVKQFGKAVLNQCTPEADAVAAAVLNRGYELADRLCRLYTEQVFSTRHHDEGKVPSWLGARVARPPANPADYTQAFNAAQIGFRWRDLEPTEGKYDWAATDEAVAWAKKAGLALSAGPVIDLGHGTMPDWAAAWEGDLPTLAAFMCDFLETVIGRYKDRIRRWQVCAGFNFQDRLGLSDDDRLRLAARLFEAAAQIDPSLELVLSLAQPWGDYLTSDEQTISPLAFADDLIRYGLRISGIELELRVGCSPRGSLPRDMLETCRVIDLFGLLGQPLELLLSFPSGTAADPQAAVFKQAVVPDGWRGGASPDGQADWGASFAALALCKPHVRSVIWDHWTDAEPRLMPHAGLLDPAGKPKPLLARFRQLRAAHLT